MPTTSKPPFEPLDTKSLVAMIYDRDGRQLAVRKVEGGDCPVVSLKPQLLANSRVFVVPQPPKSVDLTTYSLARAEQLNGYEPIIRLDQQGNLPLANLPEYFFDSWRWKRCCLRGRITNRRNFNGVPREYPVCNATLHVCEVDRIPRIIDLIPNELLARLRDLLRERTPRIPIPLPVPDPFPPFQPRVNRTPDLPGSFARATISDLGNRSIDVNISERVSQLSLPEFRQALVTDFQLFQPYFCWVPGLWNYIYRCEELTTVVTDVNGRYEACFWHHRFGDTPDLYLWLEYPLEDGMTTIYRPSIACNTYWNHDCEEAIDLQLNDDRIPLLCGGRLLGEFIWLRSIGQGVHPLDIQQNEVTTNVPANSNWPTVGLTRFGTGSGSVIPLAQRNEFLRPFQGSFPLIVEFGNGLIPAGITHYRWSYRRTHDVNLTRLIPATDQVSGWEPLNEEARSKTYLITEPAPGGGSRRMRKPFPLGPDYAADGLPVYRIHPDNPPGPVAQDPDWEVSFTYSGQVDTINKLNENGLYELKMECFNADGELVDVDAGLFQITDPDNPNQTTPATSPLLAQSGARHYLRFKMRVDNQPTELAIFAANLEGDEDSVGPCGFIEYENEDQEVFFEFTASHPNHFATFNFNVERGRAVATSNPFPTGDISGLVGGVAPIHTPEYAYVGGNYLGKFRVKELLGSCVRAAFSQGLSIRGLHTDGTHVDRFSRRSVSNAFALAPAEEGI